MRKMNIPVWLCATLLTAASGAPLAGSEDALKTDELVELSFDELLGIEITSVSKKAESLRDAPAAVFVITADDLRRSGVRSIPDALRMVPGVQVAQIDANKWAVTARGFNGRFANKLLVLMDGRSLYSPAYSGVYWESQDTFLEDIDRIEVIRGPGATLWGANAVNGVINIITRAAGETQGTRVYAGIGDELEAFGGARHGFRAGEDTDARLYVKYKRHDAFELVGGADSRDDWDSLQGGFRVDHTLGADDELTVQGDVYTQDLNKYVVRPTLTAPYASTTLDRGEARGANLLARWNRSLSDHESVQLQAYVDHYRRSDLFVTQTIGVFDLDFQHRFKPAESHEIVWGLGYRFTDTGIDDAATVAFTTTGVDNNLFSAFVQDEITLVPDRWTVILGSKFEHNDFTGFEVQPSARVVFKPAENQTWWAAVSRAVRTPSVGEQYNIVPLVTIPPGVLPNLGPFPLQVINYGDHYDESENQLSYEVGWRMDVSNDLSLDAAAYYTEFDDGRVAVPGGNSLVFAPVPHVQKRIDLVNELRGETYGIELAASWQASDNTRLQLAYSHQRTFEHSDLAPAADSNEGSQPRNQLSLRTDVALSETLEANLWLRYVDELSGVLVAGGSPVAIPAYTEADLQLTWRPQAGVALSLVGRNLLSPSHPEYVHETFTPATEVERSVYGYVKVDF